MALAVLAVFILAGCSSSYEVTENKDATCNRRTEHRVFGVQYDSYERRGADCKDVR